MYILWTKLPWRVLLLHLFREAFPPRPEVCSGQLKGEFTETLTLEVIVWQMTGLLNVDSCISSCCYCCVLPERL